jgi:hypothetical protein
VAPTFSTGSVSLPQESGKVARLTSDNSILTPSETSKRGQQKLPEGREKDRISKRERSKAIREQMNKDGISRYQALLERRSKYYLLPVDSGFPMIRCRYCKREVITSRSNQVICWHPEGESCYLSSKRDSWR